MFQDIRSKEWPKRVKVVERADCWTLKVNLYDNAATRGRVSKEELRRPKWVLAHIIKESREVGIGDWPKGDLVGRCDGICVEGNGKRPGNRRPR
jgi:hypothetical protein